MSPGTPQEARSGEGERPAGTGVLGGSEASPPSVQKVQGDQGGEGAESGDGSVVVGGHKAPENPATGGGVGANGVDGAQGSGRPLPRGQPKFVSERDLAIALRVTKGDRKLAAIAVGLTVQTVKDRITKSPQLRAIYGAEFKYEPDVLDETKTMVRTPSDIPLGVQQDSYAEAMLQQDRIILRDGLEKAGISKSTIEKIKSLDGLAPNSARFLSVSLDFTHRLHIYAQAALLEEMDYIRQHYLRDEKLPSMEKVFWQRAYNEIADLLGKGADRTIQSTQAMMAMLSKQQGNHPGADGRKAKPGWKNARRANVAP